MEHKIVIEENKERGYKQIKCTEGHYLTNWDKNDIKEYSYCRVMFAPIDYDISGYYCVDEEEHNRLVEEQIKALEEDNKEIN